MRDSGVHADLSGAPLDVHGRPVNWCRQDEGAIACAGAGAG
jgi:hypothetical protein